MKLLERSYKTRLPWQINAALLLLVLLTITALVYFALGIMGRAILPSSYELGSQGDFVGGHLGSIFGSITLIVVIITSYLQLHRDREFRLRELFLNGVSAISSYEDQEPGAPQAMRILDYLAAVALQLQEDELLLILNTVITQEIDSKLRDIEKKAGRQYPNAILARREIAKLLEEHYRSVHGTSSV